MTIRKGSSYRDRPPHDKTEATRQFERELDEETSELLTCPFCGGEAELKLYQNGDWQIICYHADGCIMRESDLSDCYWESVQTLARQWNTRADYHGYEHAAIEAWESIKAWNTRAELGSGTLTAEQVMAIAGKHQPDYCSDTHVCFDWQAIADELNAELGSGTCSIESSYLNDFTSNHECWYEFEMQCGYKFTWDEMEPPTYCPNCGRKVVSE